MLRNSLLIAWRNLKRDKLFAALNIIGLALGIVACMLIHIHVQDELSFDGHHAKAARIYRVQGHFDFGDTRDDFGVTQFPLIPTLLKEYPEIEGGTLLYNLNRCQFKYNGQEYAIDNGYYADTSYFRIFDFRWISGGPHALDEPDNLVITRRAALGMFGADDPMGKLVERNGRSLKVAGVIDDEAYNTHIPMGCWLSLLGMPPKAKEQLMTTWGQVSCYNYVVLAPGVDEKAFQPKMDAFTAKYIMPFWKQTGFEGTLLFNLEPLRDVHFNNDLIYDTPKKGNRAYVTLFAIVAVLILAIACINYINMSTADATRRAKEVALRKVSGAQRRQLVVQFIGGSLLVAGIAIVVALVLLKFALPVFNDLSGKSIGMGRILSGSFIALVLFVMLVVGVLAGSYPAIFLSRFAPQLLLKEGVASGAGKQRVRKVLMGLQFGIALFMVTGTLAVFAQLHWLRSNDMGLRKENVLVVKMPSPPPQDTLAWDAIRPLKEELARESFVQAAAFTDFTPGGETQRWVLRAKTPEGVVDKPLPAMSCDADYPGLIGMQLTAGRLFDPKVPSDRTGTVVVNESLVKAFGFKDPLASVLYIPGDPKADPPVPDEELRIIGVVKDFHYASLHTPIEPIAIFQGDPRYGVGNLMLRLAPGDVSAQLAALRARFAQLQPNAQWQGSFLTDDIAQLYQAEDKLFRVFTAFAGLAIVLTMMGLYGLAYFTARQRTREIGIRRVMGAPISDIVRRMNREFVVLLGLALLVAFPLAFLAIGRWLETFAYHADVSPWLYVAALSITLLVTVLTVTVQAYRAAIADPVKALRYE
ncbi:MAG TPA: FtsX-like permease family protein [Flavobacteriales bacterium]